MRHQNFESRTSDNIAADFIEHIALLAILICLVIFLPSCKTTQQAVSPPAGCEESILYKNLQAARVADAALVIGISVAATNHPETKPYLEKAVDRLSEMLDDNQVTYVEFLEAAVANMKWLNSSPRITMTTSNWSIPGAALPRASSRRWCSIRQPCSASTT